jgi:hypothetical protein
MPTEKELLARIEELEELNSLLQDKLDAIWSILAPEEDDPEQEPEPDEGFAQGFVQIEVPKKKP